MSSQNENTTQVGRIALEQQMSLLPLHGGQTISSHSTHSSRLVSKPRLSSLLANSSAFLVKIRIIFLINNLACFRVPGGPKQHTGRNQIACFASPIRICDQLHGASPICSDHSPSPSARMIEKTEKKKEQDARLHLLKDVQMDGTHRKRDHLLPRRTESGGHLGICPIHR